MRPAAATIVIVLLALAIRAPLIGSLSSTVHGGASGDGGIYLWLSEIALRSLSPESWFEAPIFYPYGKALAFTDNFILPAAFASGLRELGASEVLAFNLTIFLAHILNGLCSYYFARTLGADRAGGIIAAVSLLASAPLAFHLGHPQLQFLFWAPLSAALCIKALKSASTPAALGCGLALFGAFLSSVYSAIFSGLLVGIAILVALWARAEKRAILQTAFTIALGALPTLPFAAPYLASRDTFGARGLYEPYYFAASGASLVAAPPTSWLYSASANLSHDEAFLFTGILILAGGAWALSRLCNNTSGTLKITASIAFLFLLGISVYVQCTPDFRPLAMAASWIVFGAALTLVSRIGRNVEPRSFSAAIVVSYATVIALVMLGPLGNPEKGDFVFGVFRIFYETIPGFDSLRAVGRFGLLLPLVLATALALSRPWGRHPVQAMLVVAVIVAENLLLSLPTSLAPRSSSLASVTESLRQNEPLIVLPLTRDTTRDGAVRSWGDYAELNTKAMLLFANTRSPIVNGYSGQRPKLLTDLVRETRAFPSARSITALRRIGDLRTVVYVGEWSPKFARDEFLAELAKSGASVLAEPEPNSFVIDIASAPAMTREVEVLCPASTTTSIAVTLRSDPSQLSKLSASINGVAVAPAIKHDPNSANIILALQVPTHPEGSVRPLRALIQAEAPAELAVLATRCVKSA